VTVSYTLPVTGHVRVTVHDAAGRTVAVLRDGERAPGAYTETWSGQAKDGGSAAPGIYVVRVEQAGRVATGRMARLR
jgi:hypothetical protein